MTTLEDGFEDAARDALLDAAAEALAPPGGPVAAAVERSREILRQYAEANDYDVGPILRAEQPLAVFRDGETVRATWGWRHPAAIYWEFGTSPHTVQGDPVLSFVWEDPPAWVREEFEPEGDGYRVFLPEVEVSGLPESRFVRAGLDHLRRTLG